MPNFYGTVAGYKAYHLERNNDVPADTTDEEIQAALLVASEWIDAVYVDLFGGIKVGHREQVRAWPRTGAYDINNDPIDSSVPPTEIEQATYQAAWRQIVTPGSLSLDYQPFKYKRVSVDGAISVEWNGITMASEIQTQFTIIDQILYPILTGQSLNGSFSSYSGSTSRV